MNIEPHISLVSSMMLTATINSFIFATALLFRQTNRVANRYLAALLALLGLALLHEFCVKTSYILYVKPLIGSVMQLDPIIAPLLYLYIRELTTKTKHKTQSIIPHFIPALLYFLFTAPFYSLDTETKLAFVQQGYAVHILIDKIGYGLTFGMILVWIQYSIYMVLSILCISQHKQKIGDYFSYREKITLTWLHNIIVIALIYHLSFIAFGLLSGFAQPTNTLMDMIMGGTIIAIHYLGIQGLLQPQMYSATIDTKEEPTTNTQTNIKYKKSALTPKLAQTLLTRLNQAMTEHQLFLHSNLTLPELAKHIASSPQYVSQVLNEYEGQNFFDYVNGFRIDFAKQLLANTSHSIIDITYASGFNSKSAFYKAFKKSTGLTPAQFRRNLALA
jgi:AraC-like DNA-binding protein